MQELLQYYAELIPLFMTIASVAIVVIEWLALTWLELVESHREGWANVFSAALTFLPVFLLNELVMISFMFGMYYFRFFDLGFEWWVWVLAYVGYDFMSFVTHWISHKVRFFWAIHSVHHSPQEMKASVAFRGSFAEFLIAPHIIIWLPLLGFNPLMIIIVEGIAMIYGVFLHLNERFAPQKEAAWLKKILITPSAHRLHHASNDVYVDRNYGLTFSLWDNLFRTYQHQLKEEPPKFGLQKELDAGNLWVSQTDEFKSLWQDVKSANRLWDKVQYLFRPPGWHPGKEGTTAREIRMVAARKYPELQRLNESGQ